MASVNRQILIDVEPHHVWAAIRDFGAVERLVPGFVVDCKLEQGRDGEARLVTFADGRVARELLVDIDDRRGDSSTLNLAGASSRAVPQCRYLPRKTIAAGWCG
jgi:hypothetical protein